eukprot:2209425-Rhodomonas_salina.1
MLSAYGRDTDKALLMSGGSGGKVLRGGVLRSSMGVRGAGERVGGAAGAREGVGGGEGGAEAEGAGGGGGERADAGEGEGEGGGEGLAAGAVD